MELRPFVAVLLKITYDRDNYMNCVEWESTNTGWHINVHLVKLNIMGTWEWGIYGLHGWGSYGKVSYCFGGDTLKKMLVFRGEFYPIIT